MSFTIYPAIDVRDGRVVRLHQGDYARETRYPDDPYALAMRYADAGATWLHLVDLNAARDGGYTLQALLQRIVEDGRMHVQTGGGIRSSGDVEALLALGARRVVIGSLAVELRERVAGWLGCYGGDRVTIALDARCGTDGRWWPATRGWTGVGQATLGELVRFYSKSGLRHLLCTDIARDGTLAGPNIALYTLLREWAPKVDVQASGGARNVADIEAARAAGCAGIVLGKSLLDGGLTLAEALAC